MRCELATSAIERQINNNTRTKTINPMIKLLFLFITIYIPLKTESLKTAKNCEEMVSESNIFLFFKTKNSYEDRNKYFSELVECLKANEEIQKKLDSSIIMLVIDKINDIEENKRKDFVRFLSVHLLKNAKLGNTSSMHNYAMFQNEDPNSPNYKYFPENQKKFSYWTHKAASLKEPRAIFNLAIRYSSNNDIPYFERDLETSFRLFYYMKTNYSNHLQFKFFLNIIDKNINELQKALGEQKVKYLIYTNNDFNFETLATGKTITKEGKLWIFKKDKKALFYRVHGLNVWGHFLAFKLNKDNCQEVDIFLSWSTAFKEIKNLDLKKMKFRIEGKNKNGKLILPVVEISNFTSSTIIMNFEETIQNADFINLIKDAEEIKFKIIKPRKSSPLYGYERRNIYLRWISEI